MPKPSRVVVVFLAVAAGCASNGSGPTSGPVVRTVTQPVDPIIARIRDEGLNRSQVMETLDVLCNVIGPRLTASPGQQKASAWTRDQFAKWGLSNAHLEPWGPFGRGWSVDRFSMRVTAPTMFIIDGYPKAWSPGMAAPLSADVAYIDAKTESDVEAYAGKLAGKIVLIGQPRTVDARFEPLARRLTDDDLTKLATWKPGQEDVKPKQANDTANERRAQFREQNAGNAKLLSGGRPTTKTTPTTTKGSTSPATTPATYPSNYDPVTAKALALAAREGAALVITTSSSGDGGTFFVQAAQIPGDPPRIGWGPTTRPRVWSDDAPKIIPQVAVRVEDFNRLVHIARYGDSIHADVDVATSFHGKTVSPENTIAELPGTDRADEVVMVGAHLDSWHSATGATDNAIGSACAMEAIRILKSLDLKPRRTIRVALWTGEEQGIFGSDAYVREHFGYYPEPTTQIAAGRVTTLPTTTARAKRIERDGYKKFSVYFNLDNGAGKIRGIYAEKNSAAVPLFQKWLIPFADVGAKTVTLQTTGSTDHICFDEIGLPGFQFIQDPIEYGTRTHHSNMDTFDRLQPNDAKQAATILAAFLWEAATMDERFPRKPESGSH